MDNQTVSSSKDLWFADHESQKIEAGDTYEEILYIDEPPADYKEATIKLNATNESGETESLAFPILLSDVDALDITPTDSAPTEQQNVYFVEAQEVYNNNGVRVTVPEQELYKVLPSTVIENNMVDFAIECDWKYGAGLAIREVYINGKLVNEEDQEPNANQFGNNEPYQFGAYLGENGVQMLLESGSEVNEVSIDIFVEDPLKERSEEITVTIPVIIKTED